MKRMFGFVGGFVVGIACALACEMPRDAQGQTAAIDAQPNAGDCRQWQFAFKFAADSNQVEGPMTIDPDWEPFGYQNDNGLHYVALRRCVAR